MAQIILSRLAHVANGSAAEVTTLHRNVRFAPKSRHSFPRVRCPFRAKTGSRLHSTTSSADASSAGGIDRPSVFAVLRLITMV
jgi:hypothetical protein